MPCTEPFPFQKALTYVTHAMVRVWCDHIILWPGAETNRCFMLKIAIEHVPAGHSVDFPTRCLQQSTTHRSCAYSISGGNAAV